MRFYLKIISPTDIRKVAMDIHMLTDLSGFSLTEAWSSLYAIGFDVYYVVLFDVEDGELNRLSSLRSTRYLVRLPSSSRITVMFLLP